jgi:hypothetical protein
MKRTTKLLWMLALGFSASTAIAQEHEGRNYTTRVVRIRGLGHGFLGVQLTPLTPELRVHFGVPEDTGVMVARVEEGGPAEAAGIRVADILSAIDGERIDNTGALSRAVRHKEEGDSITIELYRDGSLASYPVTVGKRDRPVIDLAGGYRFMPDMLPDDLMETLNEESMEAFEEAMRGLGDHFESAEWREKLERVEELDFTAIQERMQEVERRLQELEQELEQETKEKL